MHKMCKELQRAGVDMNTVMSRFMGNETLYIKFLMRFVEDENFRNMQSMFQQGNLEEAFKAAHTLKGLIANLGLDGIMRSVTTITERLRNGNTEGVSELMQQAEWEYEKIMDILNAG